MKEIRKESCEHCGVGDEFLTDILCNKCGKTCKIFIDQEHKHFNYEGLRAWLVGGYGSRWDTSELSFDLCEPCTAELIESFIIPPETEEEVML